MSESSNMADLRPWLHELSNELDSLRGRIKSLESEIKTLEVAIAEVRKQGTENNQHVTELRAALQTLKDALAEVYENLGKLMAKQASFEASVTDKLDKIAHSVVVGNSKAATRTHQWVVTLIAALAAIIQLIMERQ